METAARRPILGKPAPGISLVELLIVIMIVAILAAVAVPYLGYTKDARSTEAKRLASSVAKALRACADGKGASGACTRADVAGRVGIDASGDTGDGRWNVAIAELTTSGNTPPTFSGTVGVTGKPSRDTDGIALGLYLSSSGVTLRCDMSSLTVPAITAGAPC